MLATVASPYATKGTHLWFEWRRATTVATANTHAEWPDGKLPADFSGLPLVRNQVLEKLPWGGTSSGRSLRVALRKAIFVRSTSTHASAANRPVRFKYESFLINPA